jgi:HemY protein
MRTVVWFVVLFIAAVVAATALRGNDGLVSIYWGPWRTDVSLNLFVLLWLAGCVVIVLALHALRSLLGLPAQAQAWRESRREQAAQGALREALALHFGGRYSRAHKAAQRALDLQPDVPALRGDDEFALLGQLLAASSLHRLQDRTRRDDVLREALAQPARGSTARAAEEGARLLAAEWALDDRDEDRALELLGRLPPGVARRTQALRLRLKAQRLARQPLEALRTARLLAKHQGFSPDAARGLLRSLAFEALAEARDAEQLRRVWAQFDDADRADALVVARAAQALARFGDTEGARQWLLPAWERLAQASDDERAAVAWALVSARDGVGTDWLPRIEAAANGLPRDAAVGFAAGMLLAECGLWGKAGRWLERAARDDALDPAMRRQAWVALARLAENEDDAARTAQYFRQGAQID